MMKESKIIAHNEIIMLKAVDDNVKFDARHHRNRIGAVMKSLAKSTNKLIDKDGNNIGDFFVDNGIDNHGLPLRKRGDKRNVSAKGLHENILDTINAVKGDTETLLNE